MIPIGTTSEYRLKQIESQKIDIQNKERIKDDERNYRDLRNAVLSEVILSGTITNSNFSFSFCSSYVDELCSNKYLVKYLNKNKNEVFIEVVASEEHIENFFNIKKWCSSNMNKIIKYNNGKLPSRDDFDDEKITNFIIADYLVPIVLEHIIREELFCSVNIFFRKEKIKRVNKALKEGV